MSIKNVIFLIFLEYCSFWPKFFAPAARKSQHFSLYRAFKFPKFFACGGLKYIICSRKCGAVARRRRENFGIWRSYTRGNTLDLARRRRENFEILWSRSDHPRSWDLKQRGDKYQGINNRNPPLTSGQPNFFRGLIFLKSRRWKVCSGVLFFKIFSHFCARGLIF